MAQITFPYYTLSISIDTISIHYTRYTYSCVKELPYNRQQISADWSLAAVGISNERSVKILRWNSSEQLSSHVARNYEINLSIRPQPLLIQALLVSSFY